MKKILFLLLSFLTFNVVYAFDINIDEIHVGSRGEELKQELDNSYHIDTDGFNHQIVEDKDATALVRKLIKMATSDASEKEKLKEYGQYMYIDTDDGAKTLAGTIFRDMYFDELKQYNIKDGYISSIKTVPFNDDLMAFAYIKEAKVNNRANDVILAYWLKKNNGDYKVYYPWVTIGEKLEDYFHRLARDEDNGDVIGDTYNAMSLESGSLNKVEDEVLNKLYMNNRERVVQITGLQDGGVNMYGSGFFLREGIVVTTWSLMQQFLSDSDYLYVNDVHGNTYSVEGVVAASIDYDVVVLKLNKEAGQRVSLNASKSLDLDDKVFMINSRNNVGFSINYGTFVALDNGRLQNLLAISSSDVGSALFDKNGDVIGFCVKDQLNSELSYANSTDYLIELQNILINTSFRDINYTDLEIFKERYYLQFEEEKVYNVVSDKTWNKYRDIGKVEEKIRLDLIKASYEDGILSLRYKASNTESLDAFYLIAGFTSELESEGFGLVQNYYNKKVYENKKHRVVIKEDFNYLIVLIMEK